MQQVLQHHPLDAGVRVFAQALRRPRRPCRWIVDLAGSAPARAGPAPRVARAGGRPRRGPRRRRTPVITEKVSGGRPAARARVVDDGAGARRPAAGETKTVLYSSAKRTAGPTVPGLAEPPTIRLTVPSGLGSGCGARAARSGAPTKSKGSSPQERRMISSCSAKSVEPLPQRREGEAVLDVLGLVPAGAEAELDAAIRRRGWP